MKTSTFTTIGVILALSAGQVIAAGETPPPPPPGEPGKHFSMSDTNKDGVISKEEWRVRGDQMFDETDANKDGKITAEEMKAAHDKKGPRRGKGPGMEGPGGPDADAPPPPPPADAK